MNELDEVLAQYCPACGAGLNGDGTFRLPRGFPCDAPCAECERRRRVRAMQIGARYRMELERRFLELWLNGAADEPALVQVPAPAPQ